MQERQVKKDQGNPKQKLCGKHSDYDAECWVMRREYERKLKTTKMSMLHMLHGKTLRDQICNDKICKNDGGKKYQ